MFQIASARVQRFWSLVLSIGYEEGESPILKVRLYAMNAFSAISIILALLFCTTFSLSGSLTALQGFTILPVSISILYLNYIRRPLVASFLSVFGMMALVLALALLDRRTGTEYLLLAISCSSVLLFEKRITILVAFMTGILCHAFYTWYDGTYPFIPDQSIPYTIVQNCLLYVSVFFVIIESIVFRQLIIGYSKKLEESNTQVSVTNEELRTQAEQLDWIVQQKGKELQSYIDAININICSVITSREGRIIRINEPFLKLAGYASEELVDQTMRVFNSGYHDKSFFDDMQDVIFAGQAWRGEIKNKAKNGSYFWLDMVIMPLRTDDRINYFLSLALPITDRKITEEERIRVNQVFETIAFDTSHRVRAPLARIKGLTNLFKKGHIKTEEVSGILDQIIDNADDLDEATRKLTSFVNKQSSNSTS